MDKKVKSVGADSGREFDLEIVSSSWLSLNEADGFDQLMESWSRKIDANQEGGRPSGLVDRVLARQLGSLERMLSLQSETRHVDPLENAVQSTPAASMVLSPDGTVTTISEGGEQYFGVKQGRRAGPHWLREESAGDFASVRRNAMQRANSGYAILKINSPTKDDALAEAYTLEVEGYSGAFTVVRSLELEWSGEVGDNLSRAFGLSDSEVEICKLLFRSRDLDKVAKARGVTLETSRTQLKRIFSKAELRSKVELIRLLGMLCARAAVDADSLDLKWSDPLGRETLLTRPDGRKLAYTWIGAEHGREVLFVHGEIPYFFLGDETDAKLAAANVKMICISMPGHGSSDPARRGIKQLDDGCAAIEFLIAELGGKRMPAIGSYSGMIYPLVLGGKPDSLLSAISVIGMPFNVTVDAFRKLPLMQKTLSQLAIHAPKVFELTCRIGYRMLKREGPDFYLKRAFDGCELDLRTVADANYQPLLRAACRHLTAQGYKAFVREEVTGAQAKPRELLENINIPFHWLVPGEAYLNDPAFCRAAKKMKPGITVELVPGAGELLPYQRPDLFVERMAQLASDDPAAAFAPHDDFAVQDAEVVGSAG